jgi:ribosomal protein L37AE/L43A
VDDAADENELIAWQDALDQIAAGRAGEAACPFCKHKPVTVEEVDLSTRISCSKCGRFVQGRFAPE